ncbi:MAG TPA: hypothetical protein PLD88_12780, partial [Candidatus Berkiella sp.]|nr:hypothetical protein [Candidatus Berkiella sp.]
GGGITLVNELMSKEKRGLGTMIIATAGICGGIASSLVSHFMSWQSAYILGGLGGFVLLLLRIRVKESSLFTQMNQQKNVRQGDPLQFFRAPSLLTKYLKCLLVG